MMSADECTKRASDCLKAAEASPDDKGRRVWQQLADAWTTWSTTIGRLHRLRRNSDSVEFQSSREHLPLLDYNGPPGMRAKAGLSISPPKRLTPAIMSGEHR